MRSGLLSDSFLSHLRRFSILLGAPLLLLLLAGLLSSVSAGDNGGGALDLDGTDDYVDIGDIGLNLSTHTVEFWIKPDSVNDDSHIVGNLTGSTVGYGIRFSGNQIQIWPGSDPWVDITSSGIPDGQWTHVAIVYNSDVATGYVNGVQELTGVSSAPTLADDLGLGAPLLSSSSLYFDGQVDEVRFWNVARLGVEIRADMHVQPGASGIGLVAYYKFDGTSPDTAHDSTESYHGALVNSPTRVAASTAPIGDEITALQSEISALWSPVDPASSGGLYFSNDSFFREIGDDIVFGHNNLTGNTVQDIPAAWSSHLDPARWERVWYCDLYHEPTVPWGTVVVTFNYDDAGMGAFAPDGDRNNYKLLERPGTTGDFVEIATATGFDTGAKTVTFGSVPAGTVCSYITLGTLDNGSSPTAVTLGGAGARPVAAAAAVLLLGLLALGTLGLALRKRALRLR